MKREVIALLIVAALAFLAGCATPARVEQMTAQLPAAATGPIPEAFRQNIAIKDVTGGQETNPLWTSQVNSAEFERALEASLRAANLLQINRQAGRYQLIAQLGKLEQPFVGISMTVTASVMYILVERSTGKTFWEKLSPRPTPRALATRFTASNA